ncbi:MAG: Holliday junction resolvase RuvX [Turneriella sp.]
MADRLLCIDFGLKFIGLAVADFPGITARALDTIRTDRQEPLQVIGRVVAEEKVTKFLLGFPFSETEGEIHRRIREFGDHLARRFPEIPVELTDESYSSIEADEIVRQTGIGRRQKVRSQDSQAAKIVLLRYLNAGH